LARIAKNLATCTSTRGRRAEQWKNEDGTAEVKANVDVKKHMIFFERSA
jgi:hypothetical protein